MDALYVVALLACPVGMGLMMRLGEHERHAGSVTDTTRRRRPPSRVLY